MFYLYLILSVIAIPVLNNFFAIFGESYSWWLVPVLLVGIFLGFIILHALVFFISFGVTSLNSSQDKGAKYFRFLAVITVPLIVKLARVQVRLSGIDPEDVPKDKRMLFVCNHQHDFDPVIMLSVFGDREIGFIGKKEIFEKMGIIGKIMHKLYGLPVDRENNREGAKSIIKAINIIKQDKASIGLFPEGYTNKGDGVLPLRNGSLKIAYKANAPIVVCTLNGTRQIPKRMFRRKTVVDFCVNEVIYPEDFKDLSTAQLGDKIHSQMLETLQKMKKDEK